MSPDRPAVAPTRIRHNACQRRMCGTWRTSSTDTHYRCPHDPANPRHAAAYPDHGTVAVREDALIDAIARFFDQYVFGPDRAGLLAALLPATDAGQAEARARNHTRLTADLARIETAERAQITELEQPADPAAQAYRARIRERFAGLYDQRTRAEAELKALQDTAPLDNDPALLDLLPAAAGLFTSAPPRIQEALLTAFDIQALYRNEMDQVTIWATLTDDTPRTIAALLDDPRTDSDTGPAGPGQDQAPFSHSVPAPITSVAIHDNVRCESSDQ